MNGRSHLMYPQNRAPYHMILPGGSLITELWLLERTPTGCEAQEFLQKTMCVSLCGCLEIVIYICLSDNSKLELNFEAFWQLDTSILATSYSVHLCWLSNVLLWRDTDDSSRASTDVDTPSHVTWLVMVMVIVVIVEVTGDGEVDGDDNILVDYEVCVCVFW